MARGTSKEDRAAEKAARQQESVTRRKRAELKKRAMNVAVIALLAGGLWAFIGVFRKASEDSVGDVWWDGVGHPEFRHALGQRRGRDVRELVEDVT